jgi:hypothetical protein
VSSLLRSECLVLNVTIADGRRSRRIARWLSRWAKQRRHISPSLAVLYPASASVVSPVTEGSTSPTRLLVTPPVPFRIAAGCPATIRCRRRPQSTAAASAARARRSVVVAGRIDTDSVVRLERRAPSPPRLMVVAASQQRGIGPAREARQSAPGPFFAPVWL